jgi:hypothetical protein
LKMKIIKYYKISLLINKFFIYNNNRLKNDTIIIIFIILKIVKENGY